MPTEGKGGAGRVFFSFFSSVEGTSRDRNPFGLACCQVH